jgi:hypothetical protein
VEPTSTPTPTPTPTPPGKTPAETDLRDLLARAEISDLERLSSILNRWPKPPRLTEVTTLALTSNTESARKRLEDLLANAILRDATSEFAWATRRYVLRRRTRHADDDLHEAVTRSAKKLGLRVVPPAGTISGRAASLTRAFVDKTLVNMPPEEQHALVAEGVVRTTGRFPGAHRAAQAAMLPALQATIGTAAVLRVAEAVVVQTTRTILGRELAKAAAKAVMSRAPFIASALGPAAWIASAAMIGYELQRPADRKIVPTMLCLGLIAMRRAPQAPSSPTPNPTSDTSASSSDTPKIESPPP